MINVLIRFIILVLTLQISFLKLSAQQNLIFEYSFNHFPEVQGGGYSEIKIKSPANNEFTLLSDTIRNTKMQINSFFSGAGLYRLIASITPDSGKTSSVVYPFFLNGKESFIDLRINVHKEELSKTGNDKRLQHRLKSIYVDLHKFYEPSDSVQIARARIYSESESYRPPYFILHNCSRDTLYGEHIPGYFWGSISRKINDSTYTRKHFGTLDYNFVPHVPLYPDSAQIATVGSFGYKKLEPGGEYRYELNYSTKKYSGGFKLYSIDDNLVKWYIRDRDFQKLIYDFKEKTVEK